MENKNKVTSISNLDIVSRVLALRYSNDGRSCILILYVHRNRQNMILYYVFEEFGTNLSYIVVPIGESSYFIFFT